MKISIKTLKGEQFQIDVSPDDLILVVKEKIAAVKSELPADRQKLIHSGKVLKDESPLSETGITENEFIVCMVTKESAPKKPATTAPAVTAPAVSVPQSVATLPPAPQQTLPRPVAPVAQQQTPVSAAAISQLTEMGFPEAECQAALLAARGNADLAVDFLMNGIPDHARARSAAAAPAATTPGASPAAATGIEQLRTHPQFNQLKTLVQSNPAALGQVLEAIGQQNPELLQAIHANQADFLAMMNEPIGESTAPASGGGAVTGGAGFDTAMDYGDEGEGGDEEGAGGMPNPIQMMAMLQALPPQMRAQAAASLGISPEQLQQISQMLGSLPPEQLQQLMNESGAAAAGGGVGGAGGARQGQQVIRLTAEEMASVTRLTELGFDQQDAIAAFIACDKNEALAANLLLEGWSAGGDNNGDNMYN